MDIQKIINASIDEFNSSQDQYEIHKKNDFLLLGEGSALDSLAIVNFLTKLDKNIFKESKKDLDLMNKIFSRQENKFTLLDLEKLLKNNF